MIRQFVNPPNWFTAASLFCAMYSMVLATGIGGEQDIYRAALMIMFAGVFDTVDGSVARLTRTGSEFGVQLDSLVDVVSFCVAPGILLYAWATHALGWVGLAGAFFFALCGVFRLARFNAKADGGKECFSEGLTSTMGGGTVAVAIMAHAASGRTDVEQPLLVMAFTVLVAGLMVSTVPYRGFRSFRISRKTVLVIALMLAAVLVTAVRWNLSTAFMAFGLSYIVSGPMELVVRRLILRQEWGHSTLRARSDGSSGSASLEEQEEDTFEL
jgi:CDP-diacylglycerol---serine O-phosphatidyltransferase